MQLCQAQWTTPVVLVKLFSALQEILEKDLSTSNFCLYWIFSLDSFVCANLFKYVLLWAFLYKLRSSSKNFPGQVFLMDNHGGYCHSSPITRCWTSCSPRPYMLQYVNKNPGISWMIDTDRPIERTHLSPTSLADITPNLWTYKHIENSICAK